MIYLTLFWTFFKIGLFTIGGGYAMLPLIQQEVTENHEWMNMEVFTDFVGIAESTPGPFAINISTFTGMHVGGGLLGALASTSGVVMPSLLIVLLIACVLHAAFKNRFVKAAINGAQPVTVALIASAGIVLIRKTLLPASGVNWIAIALAVVLFILTQFCKVKPMYLILIGAACGVILFKLCALPL